MKISTVIKRTGEKVKYDRQKIYDAISKANKSVDSPITEKKISTIVDMTEYVINNAYNEEIEVEDIQDIVEYQLMFYGWNTVAKSYILYRKKHEQQRQAAQRLMEQYNELLFADAEDVDSKRDNANINTDSPMGIMLKLGTEGAKCYADHFALPEEFAKADKENFYHIHDKDFSFITFNCCQIDLLKVLHGGFSTGHGHLREPNSIRSYAALAAIVLQANQNDMFKQKAI